MPFVSSRRGTIALKNWRQAAWQLRDSGAEKLYVALKKVTESSSAISGMWRIATTSSRRRIGRLQGAHLGVTRQQQVDVCCSCQRRIDAFIKYERHGDKRQWVTSSNALALPFAATEQRERALLGCRRAAGDRDIQYANSAGGA